MEPERWKQVDDLLEAALDLTPAERVEMLDRACAGDERLRREVETLLSAHDRADGFLDELSARDVATLFQGEHAGLSQGDALGHYRIISRIGAGGMGEVYLAEDTMLARKVALKYLPPESLTDERARKRLILEARAAATLDHPNICPVYEAGEADGHSFIVMQYVEGETLDNRIRSHSLGLSEALDVAVQVASALGEAHSRAIIHRDIKPQNIIITPRGQAKVVDFGLAKVIRGELIAGAEATASSLVTGPKTIVGTLPYMSPEQVRGEAVDARSDLFSLGAVLYEMITGHRAFSGNSAAETISAILTQEPEPLTRYAESVPFELERVVHKSLEKSCDRRYQSADELILDLETLSREIDSGAAVIAPKKAPRKATVFRLRLALFVIAAMAIIAAGVYFFAVRPADNALDSIAILPLVNASGDPDAEYLSDGVTEDIINSLSQLPQLRVMARTTVFRYKGRDVDAQTVGRELGVRAVVTGRVLRAGDTLNIQVELVDATTGSQLWGRKYTRKAEDIFAMQEEIATEISGRLRLTPRGDDRQRLAKRHIENTKAYELYLKGNYHLNRWTEEDFKKGIGYMQQAIIEEPRYAPAYAALARVYSLGVLTSARETAQAAMEAADKALEIDASLVEAHTSMAIARMYLDWDFEGAEQSFRQAIELNPGNADSHHWYGWFLAFMGRFDESISELRRAERLDPLDIVVIGAIGFTHYWAGQYDQAIKEIQKGLDLNPYAPNVRMGLAEIYARTGRLQEALAELEKAGPSDKSPVSLASVGLIHALTGNPVEAQKLLNDLKGMRAERYVSGYLIGRLCAELGDDDGALGWLEKGYEERCAFMAFIKVEPGFNRLRSSPRFIALLRRVGLL